MPSAQLTEVEEDATGNSHLDLLVCLDFGSLWIELESDIVELELQDEPTLISSSEISSLSELMVSWSLRERLGRGVRSRLSSIPR